MEDLKAGDVVILKSNSPKMTIIEITSSNKVNCSWFVGNELKTGTFSLESLRKIS